MVVLVEIESSSWQSTARARMCADCAVCIDKLAQMEAAISEAERPVSELGVHLEISLNCFSELRRMRRTPVWLLSTTEYYETRDCRFFLHFTFVVFYLFMLLDD